MQAKETNGTRVRVLPSLVPPWLWMSDMGFVGNIRSSEGFAFHREEGLVMTAHHSIPPAPRQIGGVS